MYDKLIKQLEALNEIHKKHDSDFMFFFSISFDSGSGYVELSERIIDGVILKNNSWEEVLTLFPDGKGEFNGTITKDFFSFDDEGNADFYDGLLPYQISNILNHKY